MKKPPNPKYPTHSEVAEFTLRVLTTSPKAITTRVDNNEDDWQVQIPYGRIGLKSQFYFSTIQTDLVRDESHWLTIMIYFGALTFSPEHPSDLLQFTNRVAARRYTEAKRWTDRRVNDQNAIVRPWISRIHAFPVESKW